MLMKKNVQVEHLVEIANNLRSQDNRCTASPIFAVEELRRVYGFDEEYAENFCWVDEGGQSVDEDLAEALELFRVKHGDSPDGYRRVGYKDEWVFVTACFTEQGCKDYLEINGHNLKEPRIYAFGSDRNTEWRAVRRHLMGLAAGDDDGRNQEDKGN